MSVSPEKYFDPNRSKEDLRVNPGRERTFSVAKVWERHHEIARLILLGWKNKDISKKLDIGIHQISNVRNSPVIQDKVAIMRGARDADTIDLSKEIMKKAPIALELLQGIIEGDIPDATLSLRAKTAENMLSRAGFGPIQRNVGQIAHGHFTSEDLAEIKERARESSNIIDADYEEVHSE